MLNVKEKMRLAFFQMRLEYFEKQVTFPSTASRIFGKVRRILISVPDRL